MRYFKLTALYVIIALFAATAAYSQNFKPGTRLWTVTTARFEIIYRAESEMTARKLAAIADGVYDRVSGLLGLSVNRVIPVVITPDTGLHNAYMNPVPYPHIVLFDTPPSLEWASFENALESLFLHELTHAVAGGTRAPALEKLQSVFGWVYPSSFNAPWFMQEGASVSFESLDRANQTGGTLGRANDPLIKQKLRQDIHENAFKTPFQATGVWDLPPNNGVYYDYGGLFSAYLQKKYGMEQYARLWKELGRQFRFSFYYYESGFYAIFKDVYGTAFLNVWEDFKEALKLDDLLDNSAGLVYGKKSLIADVASGGGKVFFLDTHAGKLFAADPASGKVRAAVSLDSSAYSLDVSRDGKRALVSTYRRRGANAGQLTRPLVLEYNLDTGRKTGRRWDGVYQGRYFRDGIAAIAPDTHNGNLVYLPYKGAAELLLRGGEELFFSSPAPVHDTWIAFTSAKKGARELSVYNYETKEVYTLKTGLKDDADRFRYMRGLRYSGGKLLFSFNHDDRMYKFASIDLAAGMTGGAALPVHFAGEDFSGGIFNAVLLEDGGVYYRGAFSGWDALMRGGAGGGVTATARLEPWERSWSAAALGRGADGAPERADDFQPRRFSAFKYLNPFNLWLPFPHISIQTNGISLNGMGIFSYIADPTDTNLVFLTAGYDWKYTMAPVSLDWRNFGLSFPVQITFSDSVDDSLQTFPIPRRVTSASAQIQFRFPLGSEWLSLYVQPSLAAAAYSWPGLARSGGALAYETRESAYQWAYHHVGGSGSLSLSLTSLRRFNWELFGTGISATAAIRKPAALLEMGQSFDFKFYASRYEVILRGAAESLPVLPFFGVKATVYGAFDPEGMTLQGTSAFFQSAFFDAAAVHEYRFTRSIYSFQWLGGAQVELKLLSLEIQRSFSHFYMNRFFLTAAWRTAYFGDQPAAAVLSNRSGMVHAVELKLGMPFSVVPVTVLPLKIIPECSLAYKLTEIKQSPGRFVLNMNISVDY